MLIFLAPVIVLFDDANRSKTWMLFVTHPAVVMLCWLSLMTCSKPSSVSQKEALPRLDNHPKDGLITVNVYQQSTPRDDVTHSLNSQTSNNYALYIIVWGAKEIQIPN